MWLKIEGQSWEVLSGDLTRKLIYKLVLVEVRLTQDNTSVEYYFVLFLQRMKVRWKKVFFG